MTEKQKADESAEEPKSRKGKVEDGIKQGIGVLSAFKDALEETIQEARDRGDLSTDRAKEVMKDALGRAQSAAEGARERLDFVQQSEMEGLKTAVDSVKARVSALEERVFGPSDGDAGADDAGEEEGKETPADG